MYRTASAISSIGASSTLPVQSGSSATVLPSSSISNSTINSHNAQSSATSNNYYGHGILMFLAGVTTYFLI